MKIRKSDIKSGFQYVLIYLLILCCGAWLYRLNSELIQNSILGICTLYLFTKIKNRAYHGVIIYIIGLIGFAYVLAFYHSQPYTLVVMRRLVECFLIAYVAFDYDRDNFCTRFIKVITLFSAISLVCYLLQTINPSILTSVMESNVGWGEGKSWEMTFYGKWLYVYRYSPLNNGADGRNNGIFTEPGLHQMVINSALFLLLFYSERIKLTIQQQRRIIFILIITCITTGSTTGYIGLIIIFIGLVFSRKNQINGKMKMFSLFILFVALIALLINYYALGDNSILSMFFVSKVTNLLVDQNGTGAARTSMAGEMIALLGNSPLLGVGYGNVANVVSKIKNVGGAIIFQMVAACGIPFTIYLLWPHISNAFKKEKGCIIGVIWVLLYINTTFSQSKEIYPALIVLPFLINYFDKVHQWEEMIIE